MSKRFLSIKKRRIHFQKKINDADDVFHADLPIVESLKFNTTIIDIGYEDGYYYGARDEESPQIKRRLIRNSQFNSAMEYSKNTFVGHELGANFFDIEIEFLNHVNYKKIGERIRRTRIYKEMFNRLCEDCEDELDDLESEVVIENIKKDYENKENTLKLKIEELTKKNEELMKENEELKRRSFV